MAKNSITRRQIFETALRMARELPAGELSVSALCAEAGIMKSYFYRQFRSLKDVFTEILLQDKEEVANRMPEILLSSSSNIEKIEQLWIAATKNMAGMGSNALGYILAFDGCAYTEKHFYGFDPFRRTVMSLIKRAQEAEEITNTGDPEILFRVIHQFFTGNNTDWAASNGEYDYHEFLCTGIRVILGAPIDEEMKRLYLDSFRDK